MVLHIQSLALVIINRCLVNESYFKKTRDPHSEKDISTYMYFNIIFFNVNKHYQFEIRKYIEESYENSLIYKAVDNQR